MNLLDETVISLSQAAREVPSLRRGKSTNPVTIWRWARHGVLHSKGNVRLETLKYAGKTATTRQALRRFLDRCADKPIPANQPIQSTVSTAVRTRSQIEAAAILDAARI